MEYLLLHITYGIIWLIYMVYKPLTKWDAHPSRVHSYTQMHLLPLTIINYCKAMILKHYSITLMWATQCHKPPI